MSLNRIEWGGAAFGILGALFLASNTSLSPWGYPLFLCSAAFLVCAGIIRKSRPIWALNLFYFCLNIVGTLRWFNVI